MPEQRRLVIVQDCETQFDAPLYADLHHNAAFALHVYYTQTKGVTGRLDPELGTIPRWDHLQGIDYPHTHYAARDLLDSRRLAREIVRRDPTHVILSGYSPPSHLLLALLLRRAGISIGLRSDNSLEHSSFRGLKGAVKRVVLPRILALYAAWHPVGGLAETYLHTVSRTQRPVFRFAYATDNAWFAARSAACHPQRSEWREARGWGGSDRVILGVLKWHPREDPLTLVRAFIRLRQGNPKARLVLIGDGPLRDAVHAAVAECADAVYLPGYVPYSDLPCWYGLADLFVHPAPSEPWGVSVNEAMACGLPVIASDGVGAGFDLIQEGVTGMRFPMGSVEALADRLQELTADPDKRKAMGEMARERVSGWDYGHTRQALEQVLAFAAAGGGR